MSDPLAAAQAILDAMRDGDVTALSPDVHFRSDVHGVLDAQAIIDLHARRRQGARFVPGDTLMKRNLIFIWFAYEDVDGKPTEQGTWIWSMDRDGRVVEWNELRG